MDFICRRAREAPSMPTDFPTSTWVQRPKAPSSAHRPCAAALDKSEDLMTDDLLPRNVPTRRFLDARAQGDPFRPLEPEIRIVQFGRVLTEPELAKAGQLIAERPDVWLRVHLAKSADLDFLKHFHGLRHLDLEVFELDSVEGLSHVRDGLQSFHFGKTRKIIPLHFLADLPNLRSLYLGGHKKDIEVLGRLVDLTQLSLRGLTFPDLALLRPLTRLRGLSLQLG